MQISLLAFVVVCAAGVGGLLAGVCSVLVWGVGMHKALQTRLNGVELNVEDQHARLTSEIKRRAGSSGAAREKENLDEAARVAAVGPPRPPGPPGGLIRLPGRLRAG